MAYTRYSIYAVARKNPCNTVDVRIHSKSAFDSRMTLTFDLLTSQSMHAERLPYTVCLPSSVLIAQAIKVRPGPRHHAHRRWTPPMSLAQPRRAAPHASLR